ncbi:MAG: helix-turn-helix domain-containing protein [Oscillospiraceae bacterium]|nr:helix-turn-helix domain-containing protein [Oscillospiraceae bacterium]
MFTNIFVHLMQSRNVSSYKFTKDTGIDNGLISKWKNGIQLPSAVSLIKIADYFEVSVDYLLGRTDNPDSHKA